MAKRSVSPWLRWQRAQWAEQFRRDPLRTPHGEAKGFAVRVQHTQPPADQFVDDDGTVCRAYSQEMR